ATVRNREKSAAAAGRSTRAPERSRPWHPQPRYGRAPAEPRLGDTELAPAGDKVMVPHASPAPLTGRPDQEATEVRAGGERGHSAPAPMADSVYQERGLETTGCRPGSFGGGEA
ncbi:unnamed protein product, partial [Laminaria digitata]